MKLSPADVGALRTALTTAKTIDLDLAVLEDGKILGINDKKDACIISDLPLSVSGVRMGIGRVGELEKRLMLFGDQVDADLRVNDKNEVSLITLQAGRSKIQFRCTSMSFLEKKYPKANGDEALAVLFFDKAEVAQLSRAAKTLGAEQIIIKLDKSGQVYTECSDSNNDQFSLTLEKPAEFMDAEETTIFSYRAALLCSLLDASARDVDLTALALGQAGSLTVVLKNHTFIALPQSQGD